MQLSSVESGHVQFIIFEGCILRKRSHSELVEQPRWDGGSVTSPLSFLRTHPLQPSALCAWTARITICSRVVVLSLKLNNGRVIRRQRLSGMDARWLKELPLWIGAHRRQSRSGESLRGEAAFLADCVRRWHRSGRPWRSPGISTKHEPGSWAGSELKSSFGCNAVIFSLGLFSSSIRPSSGVIQSWLCHTQCSRLHAVWIGAYCYCI